MPTAAGLYYFAHEAENKTRPPAILIHGAGGSQLSWPPQIRRLNGQRVLTVDLPGHGKSEGAGRQEISEYALDIIAFMKALKLRGAVIVGHSMGSAIALTLAAQYPKQVLGLGLLGSGAKLRVAPAILDLTANADTFSNAVKFVIAHSFSEQADARLKELSIKQMSETRAPVLYGDFLACDAFNMLDELPRVQTRTLILCGEKDEMTPPKFSETLRDGIPGAQLEIVPEAGHMLMLEQPNAVAKSLEQFLNTF
ncbi:MAG: alpha/beta hydrolase [Anaerolineales bacterium]|nr:alpha/beta hydrolase [Anaerolineales bacterium]